MEEKNVMSPVSTPTGSLMSPSTRGGSKPGTPNSQDSHSQGTRYCCNLGFYVTWLDAQVSFSDWKVSVLCLSRPYVINFSQSYVVLSEIYLCYYSTIHTALGSKIKDSLAWSQNNVSQWINMSFCALSFQWSRDTYNWCRWVLDSSLVWDSPFLTKITSNALAGLVKILS